MKRKIIGFAVLLAVIATIAFTLIGKGSKGENIAIGNDAVLVKGVIGSEKKPFFDDPRVQEVLATHDLRVEVETAGSRDIANADLKQYDFAFPSSAPAGDKIAEIVKPRQKFSPFYSPMAIASYKPVMELLAKNGVASQNAAGIWHINMEAYLKLVNDGTKWKDLQGAAELYNSPRSVLINSTDIRKSNSAAMYLSLASYSLNGGFPVSTEAEVEKVLPISSKLFLSQGYSESSSDDPFQNYLSQGMGAVPMVMIYESQFVGEAISATSRLNDQMVIAYPAPTVFSKHTLIPITEKADKLGTILDTDPKLIELIAEHGFRPTTSNAAFQKITTEQNVAVEQDIMNIADVPSYDMLENMLTKISNEYGK